MKEAKSIEEQINLLKERGIIIQNEKKVEEILLDIGYYRLGFYTFPFEKTYPEKIERQHIYKEGTTFKDALDLYYFDFNLRNILLKYIMRIEINLRTIITYKASMKYKETNIWLFDNKIMNDSFISYFTEKIYTRKFIQNNLVLREHKEHHKEDQYAPAWKLMECLTFGNLIKIYNSFIDKEIKKEIASQYGINKLSIFQNYLDTIRRTRNICAHGSVLYDMNLSQGIARGAAGEIDPLYRSRLKSVLNVILYFVQRISVNRGEDIHKEIGILLRDLKEENLNSYDVVKKCAGLDYTTF